MNNNSSKQVLLSVIGVAILVVAVVGVSFAFFSYVYNGTETNTVKTGTIVFTASDDTMALTNVFPTDAANADDVATVSIYGNTTYENGIDFTVKAMNVTNATEGEEVTIVPTILVKPIAVTGVTYTTGTAGVATEYNATNTLESNEVICAGTIAANTAIGTATAQTKILEISAFYDKADYHISDNTKDELVSAGLMLDSYAGTIVSTDAWNAMAGTTETPNTAYSFKIQVTAVEGATAPGTGN